MWVGVISNQLLIQAQHNEVCETASDGNFLSLQCLMSSVFCAPLCAEASRRVKWNEVYQDGSWDAWKSTEHISPWFLRILFHSRAPLRPEDRRQKSRK